MKTLVGALEHIAENIRAKTNAESGEVAITKLGAMQNIVNALNDVANAGDAKTAIGALESIADAVENIDIGAGDELAALIDGSITSITIPDSVKESKAHEFRTVFLEYCDCNNVETIWGEAFAGCGVALPSQGKYLELKMPNVKTIYGGNSSIATFTNCSAKTLDFPMLTEVNGFTIAGCTYLESITLPSVTTINETAIARCPNLSSVYIGSDCTTIHSAAFADIGTATNLVINCGFAEGAVSGAPWGATNATINYNVPVPEVED